MPLASTTVPGPRPPVRYDLTLLGDFQILRDGCSVPLPPAGQRLVAYLSVRGRPTSRRQAADALFGPGCPDRASGCLRSTMHRVRRITTGLLTTDGTRIGLSPGITLDLARLDADLDGVLRGDGPDRPVTPPGPMNSPDLSALSEELLPGWCEDWVVVERERLRQRHLHVLDVVAHRYLARSDAMRAIETALRAVSMDPYRESPRRVLISAHLSEGNVSEAIRDYDAFRCLLLDELGLAPTEQLTALLDTVGARSARDARTRW